MKQQTSFLSYVPAIVRARVFATRAQDAPYVKEAVLPDAASISPPARSGGTRVIADGPPCSESSIETPHRSETLEDGLGRPAESPARQTMGGEIV